MFSIRSLISPAALLLGLLFVSIWVLVTPQPASAATQNVVKNGGFESGGTDYATDWLDFGARFEGCCSFGGSRYGIIGNQDNVYQWIEQAIPLSADATSIEISFWLSISTSEAANASVWDTMRVFANTSEDVSGLLREFSNQDANDDASGNPRYQKFTYTIAKGAADNVTLTFAADTDSSNPTIFRIDDVRVDVTVPDTPSGSAPAVVTGSATNVTCNTATLSGSANPNGLSSKAYFTWGLTQNSQHPGTEYSIGAGTSNVPVTDTATGLSPSTTYWYRLLAYNTNLTFGDFRTFSTPPCSVPPIAAPVNLRTTNSGTFPPHLAWDDMSNNESGFYLERYAPNSSWSVIATLPANTETYTDNSAISQTPYGYRVRAYNADGYSSYSNGINVDDIDPERPQCSIIPVQQRPTVLFGDSDYLVSNGTLSDARTTLYPLSLDAGTYRIETQSWDGYAGRELESEPREQWYLELLNGTQTILTTSPTTDLQDFARISQTGEYVEWSVDIPQAVTHVRAVHDAFVDTSSENRVSPICATFESLEDGGGGTGSTTPSFCGNLITEPGEQCDGEPGCTNQCTWELQANTPPTLSFPTSGPYAGDGLSPDHIDTETPFSIRVIYTDRDDDRPDYVRLCVDGELDDGRPVRTCSDTSMGEEIDYAQGYEFFEGYERRIAEPGSFVYYFEANDGIAVVRFPEEGGFPLRVAAHENPEPVPAFNITVADGATEIVKIDEPVIFDGTLSQPGAPDAPIVDYQWQVTKGLETHFPQSEGPVLEYTFDEPGTYTVQLNVVDADGTSVGSSKDVEAYTHRVAYVPVQYYVNGSVVAAPSTLLTDLVQKAEQVSNYYDAQSYGKVRLGWEFRGQEGVQPSGNVSTWNIVDRGDDELPALSSSVGWGRLTDLAGAVLPLGGVLESTIDSLTAQGVLDARDCSLYACRQKKETDAYDTIVFILALDESNPQDEWRAFASALPGLYVMVEESSNSAAVWAHELGHSLFALPDRYAPDFQGGDTLSGELMSQPGLDMPITTYDKGNLGWLSEYITDQRSLFEDGFEQEVSIYPLHTLGNGNPRRLATGKLLSPYIIYEDNKAYTGVSMYKVAWNGDLYKLPPAVSTEDPSCTFSGGSATLFRLPRCPNTSSYYDGSLGLRWSLKAEDTDPYTLVVHEWNPENTKTVTLSGTNVDDAGAFGSPPSSRVPDYEFDVDLHMYDEYGNHVGLNPETGLYELTIPGAFASGDVNGAGPEWITVPADASVRVEVDSAPLKAWIENTGVEEPVLELYTHISVIDDNGQRIIDEEQHSGLDLAEPTLVGDHDKPVTVAELFGNRLMHVTYLSSVEVVLHSSDSDGTGVRFTEYSFDSPDGPWTEYEGPMTVTDEGRYTIYYRSTDL